MKVFETQLQLFLDDNHRIEFSAVVACTHSSCFNTNRLYLLTAHPWFSEIHVKQINQNCLTVAM